MSSTDHFLKRFFVMILNGAVQFKSVSKWMFDPFWITLADQAVAIKRAKAMLALIFNLKNKL